MLGILSKSGFVFLVTGLADATEICAIFEHYVCANYSAGCCPTAGCKQEGSTCVLNTESACTLDSSKGCSGFTEACCPISTGCEVKNNACTLKGWDDCVITASKGCSDYDVVCCPTATGCDLSSGKCALPSGVDPSCTLDSSKGCDGYTAECCPTNTGCAVVKEKCVLPLPANDCSIKLSWGCPDYSEKCCPTNTGCAKLNGKCVLPGVHERCETDIKPCSGYLPACCPISTGCIVENNQCKLPSAAAKMSLTSDAQFACSKKCVTPTDLTGSNLCAYLKCLKDEADCEPILAAVSTTEEMSYMTCLCSEPTIADFVEAIEGKGSCASADKLSSDDSVDVCKATGACKTALEKGIVLLTSSSECSALMKKMESNSQANQVACAGNLVNTTTAAATSTANNTGTRAKAPSASGSSRKAVLASAFLVFAPFIARE